jgi:hypothetical protein
VGAASLPRRCTADAARIIAARGRSHRRQYAPWERHPCRDDAPPALPDSSRPEAAPTAASTLRGSGILAATMHRRRCQSRRGQRPLPQPLVCPVGAASLPRRCTAGAARLIAARGRSRTGIGAPRPCTHGSKALVAAAGDRYAAGQKRGRRPRGKRPGVRRLETRSCQGTFSKAKKPATTRRVPCTRSLALARAASARSASPSECASTTYPKSTPS